MKPVLIVGAGISGLSTAYWLTREGVPCEIVERSDRVGGLIGSEKTPLGVVEKAANGFLADADVLELCEEVGVQLASRKPSRRKRYIFRQRPKRWPLGFAETLYFIKGLFLFLLCRKKFLEIKEGDVLFDWAAQRFGDGAAEWLIAPALQGVYAGNAKRMSVRLVLGSFFRKKKPSKIKGTLAPENGMGELISRLEDWLSENGVTIRKEVSRLSWNREEHSKLVIATSSFQLNGVLDELNLSVKRLDVETLPLMTATLFFENQNYHLDGFGCLFPVREGFYSLGVLFNSSVFENRSEKRSETWILGGAFRKTAVDFSDDEILRQISEDRKRLYNIESSPKPSDFRITRWQEALPHFTTSLENQVFNLNLPDGVFVTGNYLGRIGISQIISRNRDLARTIRKELSV